jgi:hypothetical protein
MLPDWSLLTSLEMVQPPVAASSALPGSCCLIACCCRRRRRWFRRCPATLCALPTTHRVPLHPFNRPSTQRSNARGPNFTSYLSSIRRMYTPFVLHPFIERLRAQPGFSSADPELIAEAEAHPAYCLAMPHLEPACSAIAMRRERTRSSGICMAPALGSGSGALCLAEAQCTRCLCAG